MIAEFFVDRPIFATVISVVFVLAGVVAGMELPVAQYPDVTPPTVQVTAYYPGAIRKRSAIPWPRRSKNKSAVSKACCTCRANRQTTVHTS